jgi:hypothetical protein
MRPRRWSGIDETFTQGPGSVGVDPLQLGGQGPELGFGSVTVGGVPCLVEGPVDPGVLGEVHVSEDVAALVDLMPISA